MVEDIELTRFRNEIRQKRTSARRKKEGTDGWDGRHTAAYQSQKTNNTEFEMRLIVKG